MAVMNSFPTEVEFEVQTWNKARQAFEEKHKPSRQRDEFLQKRTSIQTVKEACRDTKEKAKAQYSPALGGILSKVEIAMRVGDLAMKSAPESIGLAWTGVRLCFHAVSDDFETFNSFTGACSSIVGILISCGVYGRMYGKPEGPETFQEIHEQVLGCIPNIYREILEFSYAMKKHMDEPKLGRIAKGVFGMSAASFQSQIKTIQDYEIEMNKYANTASQQLQKYYAERTLTGQSDIMNEIRTMKDALDSSMKVNEAFMKRIQELEEERKLMRKKSPVELAQEVFAKHKKILNPTSDQESILKDKIHRRGPGTCMWIFDTAEYKSWIESANSALLWVSGGAGCGKSYLMSTVVDELNKLSEDGAVVHHFFCRAGDDATQKTDRILKHILYQMYSSCTEPLDLLEKANKAIANCSLIKSSSSTQHQVQQKEEKEEAVPFERTYQDLAKELGKPVSLIIDALDECIDREQQELLKALRKISQATDVRLRILLCGRPEKDISRELEDVPQVKVEDHNRGDIERHTTDELNRLPGLTSSEQALACHEIVSKAKSFFRYVQLAMEFLRQPWQRPLTRRLKQLPEGLDNSYSQILRQTDPNYWEFLKTCLTWTILADKEKIEVTEVIDAYSRIYFEESGEDDTDMVHDVDIDLFKEQIRIAGSAFLEVTKINQSSVLSVRHLTVSEYFLKHEDSVNKKEPAEGVCSHCGAHSMVPGSEEHFLITKKAGHLEMAITILRHLTCSRFRKRYMQVSEEDLKAPTVETLEDQKSTSRTEEDNGSSQSIDDSSKDPNNSERHVENPTLEEDGTKTSNNEKESSISETSSTLEPGSSQPNRSQGEDPDGTGKQESAASSKATPTDQEETNDINERDDTGVPDDASDRASDSDSDADVEEPDYDWSQMEDRTSRSRLRYEISQCLYHLKMAEIQWSLEEQEGPKWAELWQLIDTFFVDDSIAFRSWIWLLWKADRLPLWDPVPSSIMPLHIVAASGLNALTTHILRNGADVNVKTSEGLTPLHSVYWLGEADTTGELDTARKIAMVELLLQNGADPNSKAYYMTPFQFLQYSAPKVDHVQVFLSHGADCSAKSEAGDTALHAAARTSNSPEVIKALLDTGVDVNIKDKDGETPLHMYMRRSELSLDVLKVFLDYKADVNIEDKRSQRPLYELACGGNEEAVQILLSAGVDIHDTDVYGMTAVHAAALNGHMHTVRKLIEKGASAIIPDRRGRTPFFLACCPSGNAETALYLIGVLTDQGHEELLNQATNSGKTPLRKAAAAGLKEIVDLLLKRSDIAAVINTQDSRLGRTPLHSAAYNGRTDILRVLLEHGARTDIRDKKGNTPLMACTQGWSVSISDRYEDSILLLMEHEQKEARDDVHLLNTAAMKGCVKVITRLLDLSADPGRRDEHGWTALQLANQYDCKHAARVLTERHFVVAFKPTRLSDTTTEFTELSEDGLEVKHNNSDLEIRRREVSFLADHPVPAGCDNYYYEATLKKHEKLNSNKTPWVAVGFCHRPERLTHWMPGMQNSASPNASTWAYHGDDGGFYSWPAARYPNERQFGPGDTIGCGVDFEKGEIYYTRNGDRLKDFTFDKVSGRLHPVVGVCDPVIVKVNFGTDTQKAPFMWKPANFKDFEEPQDQGKQNLEQHKQDEKEQGKQEAETQESRSLRRATTWTGNSA